MNRLLTYPLLIWEFIGYMSIFTKQKQTSDLLPPAIGKLSIGPKSACPSSSSSSSSSSTENLIPTPHYRGGEKLNVAFVP